MRALVVFATLLLVDSRDADACSCRLPGIDLPADGAVDVPLNVRVWVSSEFTGPFALLGPDDTPVETVERTIALEGATGFPQRWIEPAAPLAPHTTYELRSVGEGDEELRVGSFTTGDATDDTPPPVPVEASRTPSVNEGGPLTGWSSCGDSYAVTFSFEPSEAVVHVARRAGVTAGEPSDVSAITTHQPLFLGAGGCSASWPGARRGASTAVAFGAYDLAGNFSGWTEVTSAVIDQDGFPGGCSSGEAAASALLLLGLRRRRFARA